MATRSALARECCTLVCWRNASELSRTLRYEYMYSYDDGVPLALQSGVGCVLYRKQDHNQLGAGGGAATLIKSWPPPGWPGTVYGLWKASEISL